MIYIPIGLQCTTAIFLKNNNKRDFALPFDYIFANPKFCFEMFELLLDKNLDISEIVTTHFFICEKRAKVDINNLENYYTSKNMNDPLYNIKYDVIFPHDDDSIDSINKYIRRFKRLKELILNSQEELCFIYTSQSSLEKGNFTIDDKKVVNDVYFYLSKIYELINKYRNNFKMIIFDSIKEENKNLLNKNIILYELNQCHHFDGLIIQMNQFFNL
jgi:hypothetical protein